MAFFRRTRGRRHDARRRAKEAGNVGAERTHGAGILPQTAEGDAHSKPQLPHEHDQSAAGEVPREHEPAPKLLQAKQDIESGVIDTDRRSAYGLSEGLPQPATADKPGRAAMEPALVRREKKKLPVEPH